MSTSNSYQLFKVFFTFGLIFIIFSPSDSFISTISTLIVGFITISGTSSLIFLVLVVMYVLFSNLFNLFKSSKWLLWQFLLGYYLTYFVCTYLAPVISKVPFIISLMVYPVLNSSVDKCFSLLHSENFLVSKFNSSFIWWFFVKVFGCVITDETNFKNLYLSILPHSVLCSSNKK